jgi:hypothetical protein
MNNSHSSSANTSAVPAADVPQPDPLLEAEKKLVATRRRLVGLEGGQPKLGLALSGGGIRSATFNLGVLQALAQADLLKEVDYLSTVSGGGYVGSFLGRCFQASDENTSAQNDVAKVLNPEKHPESKNMDWLRRHGRYLSPNGSGDGLLIAAIYLRNWVALHLTIGFGILAIFLSLWLAKAHAAQVLAHAQKGDALFALRELLHVASDKIVFVLPILLLLLLVLPLSWAYWHTQLSLKRLTWSGVLPLIAAMVVTAFSFRIFEGPGPWLVTGIFILSLLYWLSSLWAKGGQTTQTDLKRAKASAAHQRNVLTRWMAQSLGWTLGLLALAVVDASGAWMWKWIAEQSHGDVTLVSAGLGVSALLTAVLKYAGTLSKLVSSQGGKPSGFQVPVVKLVELTGFLLAFAVAVFWCTSAHGLAWRGISPVGSAQDVELGPLYNAWLLTLSVVVLLGAGVQFLNLSALSQFYGSRLIRAYLGGGNANRMPTATRATNEASLNVTKPDGEDDLPFSAYHPEGRGGPLHLLSATLNETVSGFSHLVDRDRKGIALAVGPCGMSVGVHESGEWHHESSAGYIGLRPTQKRPGQYQILHPEEGKSHLTVEELTLGNWMSISGAAFSTGMGSQTTLGLSLLLGFANVRLGYHWDSRISPLRRQGIASSEGKWAQWLRRISFILQNVLPVYPRLLSELTARHHGPNRRHWYLSDGGHFENTACYELIRRKLPLIISCDCGADPDYVFEDLANLIRKARIDFGAEITFLRPAEFATIPLGLQKCLKPFIKWQRRSDTSLPDAHDDAQRFDGSAYSEGHGTLAKVCYSDGTTGTILFIKPTLTGDEPLDIKAYHKANPKFPQQTTLDQWFDEEQWESYRCLGHHIGFKLFGKDGKDVRTLAAASAMGSASA